MGNLMNGFALEDLRVVDFTWVISGPYAMKMLADQGAQVIKIETGRTVGAFAYRPATDSALQVPLGEMDRGSGFDLLNRGKLSMLLNLKTTKGLEVARRLIEVSDVVAENFSAVGMEKLGLDYSAVRKINPKIIMISMAGMGHSVPNSGYISHGQTLQALSGIDQITGYPDRGPQEPGFTYMDYAGGAHAAFAVLAALRHRSRTGEGQYIDLSQYEAACSLAGLSLLDYTANGRVPTRVGNRHPSASPHGCYRCQGEDRWCSLAVFTDDEWRRACRVMGDPSWNSDPRFATVSGRTGNAEELDRLVEQWTSERSSEEVMRLMQQAGVEAGVVQTMEDLLTRDKHLEERGLYCQVPHRLRQLVLLEGVPYKASRTPGGLRSAGPFIGEHTEQVCREVLGMSDEEFAEYQQQGVFS